MIYVNYANAHRSPIPPKILTAVAGEMDPDQRVLGMLSARTGHDRRGRAPWHLGGIRTEAEEGSSGVTVVN
jgi:hypothetical protein